MRDTINRKLPNGLPLWTLNIFASKCAFSTSRCNKKELETYYKLLLDRDRESEAGAGPRQGTLFYCIPRGDMMNGISSDVPDPTENSHKTTTGKGTPLCGKNKYVFVNSSYGNFTKCFDLLLHYLKMIMLSYCWNQIILHRISTLWIYTISAILQSNIRTW